MKTFYEWLKVNNDTPTNAFEVKSYKGRFFKTKIFSYLEAEPLYVSEKESEMLMKTEAYVKEFPEVTDNAFEESCKTRMLKHIKILCNLMLVYAV